MAFLDNSGDIMVDAVLTDEGRSALARGDFQITKYAFGDDEINYELYNLDHPSGSSYYDLEILQTPVFEAFTMGEPLKYGLTSNRNLNLYYMPDMLFNNGKFSTFSVTKKNYVVYVAVNSQTAKAIRDATTWGSDYYIQSGRRSGGMIITVESCIDNEDVLMTSANLENYIASTRMLDLSAVVSYDNTFISSIMSAPSSVAYGTNPSGDLIGSPPTLVTRTSTIPAEKAGFRSTNINMNKAAVFIPSGGDVDVGDYVQSQGAVGSMTSLNVTVEDSLTTNVGVTADSRWTRFGNTGVSITGLADTYATINTSLEITGRASGGTLSIPLTLIRKDT